MQIDDLKALFKVLESGVPVNIHLTNKGISGLRDISGQDGLHLYPGAAFEVGKHFYIYSSNDTHDAWVCRFQINGDQASLVMLLYDLPVADPHVVSQLWNNGGVLNISAG